MAAKPLSKADKAWVASVQRAISKKRRGSRIRAYIIGDDQIVLYDKNVYDAYVAAKVAKNPMWIESDVCVTVNDSGAYLAEINFPFTVESTAG